MCIRHPAGDEVGKPVRPFLGSLLGPALLSLLVGCGEVASSTPTATVRDSAGVTIVENPETELPGGGGWEMAQEPNIVIGSFDGPEESQIYRVRGAYRLPDGRIVVANDGTREIRIFGPNGDHLVNFGGEGEGPGEFNSVILAGVHGDSLVVLDRRLRRVSLIHPDRGFIRSFNLPEGAAYFPLGAWLFASGTVLIQDLGLEEGDAVNDGFHRTPVPLRSCDLGGELQTDFGGFPGAERVSVTRQTNHGLATVLQSVPFGREPQIAVAGDLLYFGSQDAYEIEVYRSDGSLQRSVRLRRDPRPVSDAHLAAYIEAELEGVEDENAAREGRRDLEEMPRAESLPAHGAIHADASGYLFVEEFRMPGDEGVDVNVFDPEGVLTGSFEIPADIEILEIGSDYLLALFEDDMGIEYLRSYALSRPPH